jgi:hypothetical protein
MVSAFPLASVVNPAAQQSAAETQLTPSRTAPTAPEGVELGITVHALPFQVSVRVPTGLFWTPPRTAPTAQQSEPVTHLTDSRA